MYRPWFEQYQENVPHSINIAEYSSLVALFKESCQQHADKIAYSNFGSTLTYSELNHLSRNLAAYLQQLGLPQGARIAIMMPNILQYPVALFAILRAGFVVVNTNPLYTADEVAFQLHDAEAQAIIVAANFAHTIEKALPRLPLLSHFIVTELGDLFSPIKRWVYNKTIKYIKKLIPAFKLPHAVALSYALLEGRESPLHRVSLNHDDIALLQYTGGTTGVAKGALLTHGNLIANVLQASAWIAPSHLGSQDIVVTALPLYHIFSLTANCLTFLKVGAQNILITNPRDIAHFIKLIKNAKFTAITGVNTLFSALLNHPAFQQVDFSHLKLALSGGMALQKSVAQRWTAVTHKPILEAYGLTETSPAVTINPLNLSQYNESIGLPLPSTDVSIRNDMNETLPLGSCGELCVKGPQVMHQYWNKPEETRLIFTEDGFLKTGDIARMDDQGFIYLVDRKKDMIIVSGFNVYPNEVEQVLSMHPGVSEVGVIGVLNGDGNELVKACVVKKDSAVTREQLIAYCKKHLTSYKIPKIIEFFNELPKTSVGKINRLALKSNLS